MNAVKQGLQTIAICICLLVTGCPEALSVSQMTWYQKCGWKAENYFNDAKVVALCHAIEANDLNEMDRLIADGVNVNAKGKNGMTPLLWAYPDNKLDRFKKLLEHGADPNVIIQSEFNSHGGMMPGDSVTHFTCMTSFPDYFEAVFDHGGDPNLIDTGKLQFHNSPLLMVITSCGPNKKEKIQKLLSKGANINYMNGAGATPVMQAVSWGSQFDIALMLLEAGADYRIYIPMINERLIHVVALAENKKSMWTPQQAADYQKLVKWLEKHGESIAQAKADFKRWASWNQGNGEYRRKMDAEIAAREAREAAEKKAAAEKSDQKK